MPKLGEALRAIVGEGGESADIKGRPESVLMNHTRQRIFEHLCQHPASRLSSMARHLDMSPTVVQFHLRKMTAYQYVSMRRIDEIDVYYPSDIHLNDDDIAALAMLADEQGRNVLGTVVQKPGLTPAEIALEVQIGATATRKTLAKMEPLGLVAVIVDGRHNRVFPGDGLPKLERRFRHLMRGMKSRLIRRLTREKMDPEVELDSRRESTIIMKIGGKIHRLRIPSEGLMPWVELR